MVSKGEMWVFDSWRVVGSNPIWGSDFSEFPVGSIDHFTVVAKLPGFRMEARLPVTLF